VRERGRLPIVVKADGLAAGKGVVIAQDLAEADAAIAAALEEGRFGKAGAELVIEDYLEGEEVSFFALVDGETALPLAGAQDHKRVGDGDTGPNTGGMGAYSPAPVLTPAIEAEVMERIVRPTVRAMKAEGRPFKGVLFAGLMITAEGPMLIEYNTRFGDPECEVLMPRLASDLLPALKAARDGRLAEVSLRWHDASAVTVVMAARGYPGDHVRNTEIRGVEAAGELANVLVFHAGTARDSAGALRSTGGRVLAVTSIGRLFRDAHAQAYRAVAAIDWPDGFCRRDIGWRAVKAEGGV
ncbi:MAG TPA: phosphoribosylamine--glycine ligase, partial [Alphaproteobacteria bacterium]|nr:phosphoribosylamine--glycine ligase [Alphaproteobacteria bacterium]